MISMCLGSSRCTSATGQVSNASGSSVWQVYANVRRVIDHAWPQSSPSSSTSSRISSATASTGWVSLS